MSENFKPEVTVVRRDQFWVDSYYPDDGKYPDSERALLVRGVPMVGERVVTADGDVCEVIGHHAMLEVRRPNRMPTKWLAIHCSPVPDEDEALVERVAKAIMAESYPTESWLGADQAAFKREARAAIRAMREGGK